MGNIGRLKKRYATCNMDVKTKRRLLRQDEAVKRRLRNAKFITESPTKKEETNETVHKELPEEQKP